MTERSSEALLRELARGLEPVRRIPRLRAGLAAALGLWLVALAAHQALGFPSPRLDAGAWRSLSFLAVLAGLALLAGGGVLAALAAAVPGREHLGRAARGGALLGLALAAGAAATAAGGGLAAGLGPAFGTSAGCLLRAAALGLAPALAAAVFAARALPRRPLLTAAIAGLGGVGLGALAVHLSCAEGNALHVLLGHALAPLLAAALLALPLAALLRRAIRRRAA